MKIASKIFSYIALLISVVGLIMVGALLFSSTLRGDKDSFVYILLNYGCMVNSASIYIVIGLFIVITLGSVINFRQRDTGGNLSFLQVISNSLNFKKSTSLVLFLRSVSELLFVVFMYWLFSYTWGHCA